jgi:hypothetical protein
MILVAPRVGRSYYKAETALQVLDLIATPEAFELVVLVEAVGIEPTSGNPQPQASTPIAGLLYGLSSRGTPIGRITARPASLSRSCPEARFGASHQNMTPVPEP